MHEQELFRLHVTAGLDSVEVHATGKIVGVELNLVVSHVNIPVHQISPT